MEKTNVLQDEHTDQFINIDQKKSNFSTWSFYFVFWKIKSKIWMEE